MERAIAVVGPKISYLVMHLVRALGTASGDLSASRAELERRRAEGSRLPFTPGADERREAAGV